MAMSELSARQLRESGSQACGEDQTGMGIEKTAPCGAREGLLGAANQETGN
jgi:hypothetical protein